MIDRVIIRGIGVHPSAHFLDGRSQLTGTAGRGALEYHVLDEMGDARFFRFFVDRTGFHPDLHGCRLGARYFLDQQGQAIVKGSPVQMGGQNFSMGGRRSHKEKTCKEESEENICIRKGIFIGRYRSLYEVHEICCRQLPLRHVGKADSARGELVRLCLYANEVIHLFVPFSRQKKEQKAAEQHEGAEQLAHGDKGKKKTELLVRLAEEFHKNADQGIADQKKSQERTRRPLFFPERPEHQKKDHPFQKTFIELGRVAGQRPSAGKNHGPRHVRNPAVELAVDEVAKPAATEPDGRGDYINIRCPQKRKTGVMTEQQTADQKADQGAMKRHAALPGGKDFEGMLPIIGKIIKQRISQTGADHQADDQGDVQVIEMFGKFFIAGFGNLFFDQKKGGRKAYDIHQAIPADLQGAEMNDNRIDMGIGQHLSVGCMNCEVKS